MKDSISVFSVALSVFLGSIAIAASPETKQSSYDLQYEFSRATDLLIKQRWQDVAGYAAVVLKHVDSSFVLSKPGLANIGEEWSSSDYGIGQEPRALHLFTAYSNNITSSVLLVGGRETSFFALLARRGDESFCVFKMPQLPLTNLRLSAIQELLNPNKDAGLSKLAKCQWQSLHEPLALPRD